MFRVKVHPKHVEQFTEINKLCKVASCWLNFGKGIVIYRNKLKQDLLQFPEPLKHLKKEPANCQWFDHNKKHFFFLEEENVF